MHELAELVAQGDRVVEAQPPAPEQARDEPLGLAAGAAGCLLGSGPLTAQRLRRGSDPDEPRQHLAGKPARALADAVEQRLRQRQVGEVVARFLVEDLDFLAPGDESRELGERHVAARGRVVELAVAVALDRARAVPAGHAATITHCVNSWQ